METLSSITKKQIVLSRIIYDYIINGLSDSLEQLSEQETQLFVMRINIQAITHAIELSTREEIKDFTYQFNQLGVSFNTLVPLSQLELSPTFIEEHISTLQHELGDDFDAMVEYMQKMQTTL